MKKEIRNRGYIQVDFGVINHKIQDNSSVSDTQNFSYYTNNESIFTNQSSKTKYATFEKNYTGLDGTFRFLPRQSATATYYDCGLVGNNIVSSGTYEVTINIPSYDFKGLTIDFGDNYPKNFDIITSNDTIEVRNNTSKKWVTQDVIEATTFLKIRVYEMNIPENRFRINSVMFGYGLSYDNDFVIDSSLESYISPIGADIPQINFRVVLDNDNYFNVDDPNSAINYLETGQEINVSYGLQLNNDDDNPEIEWVQGCKLECASWESDDTTATIYAQDIFRSMDSQYYMGMYESNGTSYYDLADTVLSDAGITDYYIDPILKTMYTQNPIPLVKHKEALQIIANACRCVLAQTREGSVSIKSNFKPTLSISSNGETSYSNASGVINDSAKSEYASFAKNYTRLNNTMYFLPRNGVSGITTGYVSSYQSDGNSEFQTNPMITITQNAQHSCSNLNIVFGNSLPGEFIIRTYNNNVSVESLTFPNEDYAVIDRNMNILHNFDDFDKMEIEFTKTDEPYNRITVNNIFFDDIQNFVITLNDIMGSPKAIKQERVQEVVVPYYIYQEGTEKEILHKESVTIPSSGYSMIFNFSEPCEVDPSDVTLDGSTQGVVLEDPDFCWRLKVTFNTTGTHELEIKGYKYKVTEKQVSQKLYTTGKEGTTKVWKNPLINNLSDAQNLCQWLCDYYSAAIEYEYPTRGYPEIDVNDILHQERKVNDEIKEVTVNIYRHVIGFNGAFSGNVSARRLEDGA